MAGVPPLGQRRGRRGRGRVRGRRGGAGAADRAPPRAHHQPAAPARRAL